MLSDGATYYYRLDDTGATLVDSAGAHNATAGVNMTRGVSGALANDTDTGLAPSANVAGTYPAGTGEPSGASAFTIEGWVRTNSSAWQDLLSWGQSGVTRADVGLLINNTTIAAGIEQDNHSFTSQRAIADGNWHYIVLTYNGNTTLTAYLDGQSLGSQTLAGSMALVANTTLLVGGSIWCTCDPVQGATNGLDEVALYPSALTATQVANHFSASGNSRPSAPTVTATAPGNSAVSVSWTAATAGVPAGETAVTAYTVTAVNSAGVTVAASSLRGTATSMTMSGVPADLPVTVNVVGSNAFGPGAQGSSASLTVVGANQTYQNEVMADGAVIHYGLGETGSQFIDPLGHNATANTCCLTRGITGTLTAGDDGAVAPNNALVGTLVGGSGAPLGSSPFTIEAWVKSSDSVDYQALVSWGSTGGTRSDIGVLIQGSTLAIGIALDNQSYTANSTLTDGQWHQVAVSYDGNRTLTGYADGVLLGTRTLGGPMALTSTDLLLGGDVWSSGDHIQGATNGLDEVAIYPSALPLSAIEAHYGARGLKGGPVQSAEMAGGGVNDCGCTQGGHGNATNNPIDTATGNFWHAFSDLSIPGRSYPLEFARTYNSQSSATNSPIGYGWQINYGMSLSVSGSTTTITQANGSQVTFTQQGANWIPSAPRFIASLTHNGDGTWAFVRFNRDSFKFSATGQLTTQTDLNGYQTTFAYTSGKLTSVTDPAGRTLSISWSGSLINSVTDANVTPSRSTSFQYNDTNGNLTDAFDVGGGHWQFTYDTAHRMLTMKDPKCYATSGCPGVENTYDGSGRTTSQKDQLNRQTNFDYAAIPGASKVTDPKGNIQVDYYTQGLRTSMTRGYGTSLAATSRYYYDGTTAALVKITDPLGHAITYDRDLNGNVLASADALGRRSSATYNSINELLTATDPNGVTTTNTYDVKGNLSSTATPLTGTAQTQTTTYNHADAGHPGDVTSMLDPDSKTWTYGYDANGYRNSVTDPLSNKATSVFNNDGWITSQVSPKGNVTGCSCAAQYTTTFGHDVFGSLTSTTDPLSHTTTRHYDADQNLDWSQDPNGNRTTFVYDLANQQAQIQRPDTTVLTIDYNSDGTILDQKDGKNNAILTYAYDARARVTSTTDALNSVTAFGYDAAGNQTFKQDPGGNCGAIPKVGCTTFTYDAGNQLTAIAYSDGTTPNVTGITYDSDGQRTAMTDGTGTSMWAWDSLHRLTSYTNGAGAQVQYVYNLRNLATTITYPGTLNVTRAYDDAGRLTSVQDWLANTTSFAYDANSNLTTETLPAASGVVDTFAFNAADQLTAISDAKGQTSLFAATYTRDNAAQLISDSSAATGSGGFAYNQLNQLCYAGASSGSTCASPPPGATQYVYDAADNPVRLGITKQQAFNAADQVCWSAPAAGSCASPPPGATTFTYDSRGNRTQVTPPAGGATVLSFDQANRLTGYGASAVYAYNGDGLRQSKTVSSTTTRFLWDVTGSLPLLLKDASTAFVYGPGGQPLEQVSGTSVLWLHHDQIGSTRLVTDSGGATQATYTFDSFGTTVLSTGSLSISLQFAGQYRDAESGLYYLRARYYDPSTTQFISRDPIYAKTLRTYTYASNSPINLTDASGLIAAGFGLDFRRELGGQDGFAAADDQILVGKSVDTRLSSYPDQTFVLRSSGSCSSTSQNPTNDLKAGSGGGFVGVNVFAWFSNANNARDLEGMSDPVNINLFDLGGSFSYDSKTHIFLASFGVKPGFGLGVSTSQYPMRSWITHVL